MASCEFGGAGLGSGMPELIFEVVQEGDGGFVAECLTEPIVTQGDDWNALRDAVADAVKGYYFDAPESLPKAVRLHLVRDEHFALA
jgi:hypothetical protein